MLASPSIPRTGGGFAAPGGTGGYATTTQGRGSSTTTTGGGPGFGGGGGGYGDLLRKLIERKLAATAPKRRPAAALGKSTARPSMQVGPNAERGSSGAVDTPWYSQQGAATRPVGLQAGTVPGMGVDPRLLPPSMRAAGSTMVAPDHSVPTGSIASPTFSPDALYGYSAANPRAEALGNMMGGGGNGVPWAMDPVGQIVYGTDAGAPRGGAGAPQQYYSAPNSRWR